MDTQCLPAVTCRQAAAVKARRGFAAALATWSRRVGAALRLWRARHRQRRALARLSDHMLKDLGLSRSVAAFESEKRFWE